MEKRLTDQLEEIKAQLDRIEEEVKRVSKHVPFVDDLANSGVVRAVSSLNSVFSGKFLSDDKKPEIEDKVQDKMEDKVLEGLTDNARTS